MSSPERPVPQSSDSRAPAAAAPAGLADLLDPDLWRDALEKYALTANLAVALADAAGRPRGPCINPRPTWGLLRGRLPADGGGCPFALEPACPCVADALARGEPARVRDRTGLVHFAVPLTLEGRPLGALVAGQVF